MGHSISDSLNQRSEFVENSSKLIDKLVENINSRFPDGGLISSFAILDPQNLPSPADLPSYGNNEIDILSEHYGTSKQSDDGTQHDPILNGEKLKEECSFKQLMSRNFKDSSIQGMAKKYLFQVKCRSCFLTL